MKGKIKEIVKEHQLELTLMAAILACALGVGIGNRIAMTDIQELLARADDEGFIRGRTNGQILAWTHAFIADPDATKHLLSFYNKPEDLGGVMDFLEQVSNNKEFLEFNKLYDMVPKDPTKM